MILQKITPKELETISYLHDPNVLSAVLFNEKIPTLDALKDFSEHSSFHTRLYQIPYHSYEYLLAHNPKLSEEENFRLLKGAGSGYFYTGRKSGKSLCGLLMDMLFDTVHHFKNWVNIFSSFDRAHVEHLLEPYIAIMETHPFFKLFTLRRQKRSPYLIETTSGHVIAGVGMNLSSKKVGADFEHHHAQKITIDEHQYETDEVANKRSQAISELGCIYRFAGITSFKTTSPAGRIFTDLSKKNWVVNLPQYVSPAWNKYMKDEAIKDFDGEDTIGYRVHILAELIESAKGLYDIERVRECYNRLYKKRKIKHFEVDKDDFHRFKDIIVVDKWKNSFRTWIAGDWGRTAPSEIVVIFELEKEPNNVLVYAYNITLYRLETDEQLEVYEYLIDQLNPNFVGIDSTEDGGRQVYRGLCKLFPEATKRNSFHRVSFNEKLAVDFKKNNEGKILIEKGDQVKIYERVDDWSIRRLIKLLYNHRFEIPTDFKFDKQFNAMKSMQSGSRIIYGSTEANHLHQAMQVMAIMQWKEETNFNSPIMETENKGTFTTL